MLSEMVKLRSFAPVVALTAVAILSAVVVGCGSSTVKATGVPTFDSQYQAVLLDTGLVYYGKISGLDTDYPTLRDVYYVQQSKDAKSNEVSNVLIRRGNEWHGPALTVLNSKHIVLVEPVGANSKVAQLIAQEEAKQPNK
jgi:hypothetical protein